MTDRFFSILKSLFLVILLVLVSCDLEKDPILNPDGEYYFRFKLDGVQQEYYASPITLAYLIYHGVGDYYSMSFTTSKNIFEEGINTLGFFLKDKEVFKVNAVYSIKEVSINEFTDLQMLAVLFDDHNGKRYFADKIPRENQGFVIYDKAEVIFEVIADNEVKGRFSATMTNYDDMDIHNPKKVTITDGEFRLPMHRNDQ